MTTDTERSSMHSGIGQLEAETISAIEDGDVEALKELRFELSFRKRPKAVRLAAIIDEALGESPEDPEDPTPPKSSKKTARKASSKKKRGRTKIVQRDSKGRILPKGVASNGKSPKVTVLPTVSEDTPRKRGRKKRGRAKLGKSLSKAQKVKALENLKNGSPLPVSSSKKISGYVRRKIAGNAA